MAYVKYKSIRKNEHDNNLNKFHFTGMVHILHDRVEINKVNLRNRFFLDKMNIGSDEANIVLNICLLKYEAWPIQQSDMRRDGIHMYVCMDGMNSKYCFNASNPSKIKRTPIWHWHRHRQMLFIRILIHFRANIFRALFYGFFLYHTYCASIDLGQLLQYSWRKVRKWVSSIFSRINLNRVIYTSLY